MCVMLQLARKKISSDLLGGAGGGGWVGGGASLLHEMDPALRPADELHSGLSRSASASSRARHARPTPGCRRRAFAAQLPVQDDHHLAEVQGGVRAELRHVRLHPRLRPAHDRAGGSEAGVRKRSLCWRFLPSAAAQWSPGRAASLGGTSRKLKWQGQQGEAAGEEAR